MGHGGLHPQPIWATSLMGAAAIDEFPSLIGAAVIYKFHIPCLCRLYIDNLKNAKIAIRFLWIKVLVMVQTVQKTLVHLSTIILPYLAFHRHVLNSFL
jgi:hypothetical protein